MVMFRALQIMVLVTKQLILVVLWLTQTTLLQVFHAGTLQTTLAYTPLWLAALLHLLVRLSEFSKE
jgi:hypothetical protein